MTGRIVVRLTGTSHAAIFSERTDEAIASLRRLHGTRLRRREGLADRLLRVRSAKAREAGAGEQAWQRGYLWHIWIGRPAAVAAEVDVDAGSVRVTFMNAGVDNVETEPAKCCWPAAQAA